MNLSGTTAWAEHWKLRPDTTYLNHGSFGPPPEPVIRAQAEWKRRLDEQPMDFFYRQHAPMWLAARQRLASFVGSAPENLAFVENATFGMNVIASSFRLTASDEVVLTDHEYGAVQRIWQRACRRAGTDEPRIAVLPRPIETAEQVIDAIFAAVTPRTKLLVISHITSPTAIILPVAAICSRARKLGIATCIDGPHALAQLPVELDTLGCDFYAASLHKWVSAPFGTGFLYVAPPHQSSIEPPIQSWGRLPPLKPESWADEFLWSGTREPSPYLAVPAALDFLERVGLGHFRTFTHELARQARQRLVELTGRQPLVPDDPAWYGAMAHVPLPPGDAKELQGRLWKEYGIEVPIPDWGGGRYIRVSCHLYNTPEHLDRLVSALAGLLR